jgi:ribosomal protein S13
MSYILGTNLMSNEKIEITLTWIFGISFKKAIQVCDQSGLNDNMKVDKLTSKVHIDTKQKFNSKVVSI